MTSPSPTKHLQRLARRYGVQTAYYDMEHRRHQASTESLLTVLGLVGAPVSRPRDISSSLRELEIGVWQQTIEPVNVLWEGASPELRLRLPAAMADVPLAGTLVLETGENRDIRLPGSALPVLQEAEIEGRQYVLKAVSLPERLPPGYHRLILEMPGTNVETLLISSPLKAYGRAEQDGRYWGVFLPLYSLHTERSWGGGDLSDLATLTRWIVEMGGSVVGTLPMLPTFLDEPFEPSPYAPVSRLAWNEFYVDISQAPELQRCPAAQSYVNSGPFREDVQALRASSVVDYRRQMAVKRKVLEELARCCFNEAAEGLASLKAFAYGRPEIDNYAAFRSVGERTRSPWRTWTERLRSGSIDQGDYDDDVKRYYLYTQWLLHQQIGDLADEARENGPGFYLDYPLGVHPDGYDVWRHQDLFVHGASAGAPPDPVFALGQNWGFPPLNPDRTRQSGYAYPIACVRHHLRHAGVLRIDHVMGLHRLFVIPDGMDARQGVYIRYRPEEFYAILCLESHRSQTMIVGEDLGTVPPDVRPAMKRHGLHRNYVVQYELGTNHTGGLPAIPRDAVASVNTHDMPPFAGYWRGLDINDRLHMGLLDNGTARSEARNRESIRQSLTRFMRRRGWCGRQDLIDDETALEAILKYLSASRAAAVLINLEDLWLETQTQNFPGTRDEHPNWRRKARYDFETFSQMPSVRAILCDIDRIRDRGVANEG
jgi:4-alpha-glucanotransferase